MLTLEARRVGNNCSKLSLVAHPVVRLVSIGPIHYGAKNLQLGDKYKLMYDVLLLENQLPYQVLKLLSGDENDGKLLKSMNRNIQELRAAGVRLKKSNSRRLWDISFSCGWLRPELKLPEITVDDTTAPTFLNLITYEMCPDFRNNYKICSSFVAFMDSLIDHPDDVKELRSAGVLDPKLRSIIGTNARCG
ncbi:UPF0481 protein isoform X2 [Spatholobus suberectus]|nr:UPF0481 protein isoform X2 [Spatholobus suberectus]